MPDIHVVKNEMIRVLKRIEQDWTRTVLIIQLPPFINQGYNTLPSFFDVNDVKIGTRIRIEYDSEFDKSLFYFIVDVNKNGTYNQNEC